MHVTKPPWPLSFPLPRLHLPCSQKLRWDVKLPEISCDNKHPLSFEILPYSWTTHWYFSSPSPARRQSQTGSGLAPLTHLPPPRHHCCFDVCVLGGILWLNCFFFCCESWSPSLLEGKSSTILMTGLQWEDLGTVDSCSNYIQISLSNSNFEETKQSQGSSRSFLIENTSRGRFS